MVKKIARLLLFFSLAAFLSLDYKDALCEEDASPTVITADSLEVFLDDNLAVFTGKVKADHKGGTLQCRPIRHGIGPGG